tara:strand:+ start:303 stop:1139 length:837 start_codon:yes stop_codon:yes gene_type:complete
MAVNLNVNALYVLLCLKKATKEQLVLYLRQKGDKCSLKNTKNELVEKARLYVYAATDAINIPCVKLNLIDSVTSVDMLIKKKIKEIKTCQNARVHNKHVRELISLGLGKLFPEGFTYDDAYHLVDVTLGKVSLWSGKQSKDELSWKAQIRTCLHEFCIDSCQYWWNNDRFILDVLDKNSMKHTKGLMHNSPLLINPSILIQNRQNEWKKSNKNKKRTFGSRFFLSFPKLTDDILKEMYAAHERRMNDPMVYRKDQGSRNKWETNIEKLKIEKLIKTLQ